VKQVDFTPLSELPSGLLAGMLTESYAALLQELPELETIELRRSWLEFDAAVQRDRQTVGACGFITRVEGSVVGFASWDPRGWPEVGRVGHNCILPSYQGHGYGSCQIQEILRRFRTKEFVQAQARTGEHAFFAPARRMYLSCGFRAAEGQHEALVLGHATVLYEIVLSGHPAAL
jgi:GNAT superfamily N-acetyltransferase